MNKEAVGVDLDDAELLDCRLVRSEWLGVNVERWHHNIGRDTLLKRLEEDSDSESESDAMRWGRGRAVSAAHVLDGWMPVAPVVAMSAALLERLRWFRGGRLGCCLLLEDCAGRVGAAEAELALGVCIVETGLDAVE